VAGGLAVWLGAGLWTGVAVAGLTGASLGLVHALFTVWLGVSQHVAGLGLTLLATSLSAYAYRVLLPTVTTPPTIEPFQPLAALASSRSPRWRGCR